jgi:hypothetical protein
MTTSISNHFRVHFENGPKRFSGRHLGHYKCLVANDQFQYTNKDLDPNEKIKQVYHQIASSAIKWGVSLHMWQHGITSMIEKVPGCPKIDKLRVIHLYDS